jgi:hypothetical protein
VPKRVEHRHLFDNDLRPYQARSSRLPAVRNELRHRPARMRDDDLFSLSNAAEKV